MGGDRETVYQEQRSAYPWRMPRKKIEPPPPEPQEQFEGYQWLSSQWGRSGNPTPAIIGAIAMGLAAFIVLGVAIRSTTWDRPAIMLVSFVVAALCALGCWFYAVEARFAARAKREQEPFTPTPDASPRQE